MLEVDRAVGAGVDGIASIISHGEEITMRYVMSQFPLQPVGSRFGIVRLLFTGGSFDIHTAVRGAVRMLRGDFVQK